MRVVVRQGFYCIIFLFYILKLEFLFVFKVFVSLYMGKQCVSGCIYYVYVIQYNCQSVRVSLT